ncbi:hypothetical protein ACO1NJ_14970, partial [Staphylococcus aureus]
ERARSLGLPLLYAHLVGGQDEVVFDGASFAVDGAGRVMARSPSFAVDVLKVRLQAGSGHGVQVAGPMAAALSPEAE